MSAGRDTVSVMEGWTEARASRLGRLIAMLGLIALAAAFSGRGKTVEATVESVRTRLE